MPCHGDANFLAPLLRPKSAVLMLLECVPSHARLSAGPGFRAFFVRTQATLSCDQKSTNYRHPAVFKQTTPYKQHGGEWSVV